MNKSDHQIAGLLLTLKLAIKALASVRLLSVLMNGCASQPPQIPVNNPDERFVFNGFTVLPPEGLGWSWVGRPGQDKSSFFNTTFVKQDGDRTYVARAWLLDAGGRDNSDLENLMDWLKTSDMLREGPRQKGITHDLREDHSLGTPCVRYDFDAEDTRPVNRPGMVFDLDGHGFACPHPKNPGVLAQIGYSRRTPKGQPYLAGLNEGERFMKSIKFTAVRR